MHGHQEIALAVAAPAEAAAVLRGCGCPPRELDPGEPVRLAEGLSLVRLGVGPVPAAVHAARLLADHPSHGVVNLGVAGAYPGLDSGPDSRPGSGFPTVPLAVPLGGTVLATRSLLADHGALHADGFEDLAAMGFPPADDAGWEMPDSELSRRIRPLAHAEGPIATVGAVSGTDSAAAELARRTGAVAEAMEGAAVAFACYLARVPFAEVRVISNVVGDRGRYPWRLDEALMGLSSLSASLSRALIVR
ncbi:MAG: futalosine hydrolase [Planctomycetota bacterium]